MPMQPSVSQSSQRRDANARISFFDPANQAVLDRLLSTSSGPSSRPAAMKEDDDGKGDGDPKDFEEDTLDEGDTVAATLANIEEMLEGYEWISDGLSGLSSRRGPVEHIESRLLDELMLLEKVGRMYHAWLW